MTVRMTAEIWNSILYVYSVSYATVTNRGRQQHTITLYIQYKLNFAAGSFCCKITLI